MPLRLLHTADWHLGHTLHGHAREAEHAYFLDWLIRQLEAQAVDALVVAGDVFDSQNPPVAAQSLLFGFLARARAARPGLQVVLIAGNHDSGSRLDAPAALLEELGVRVVGQMPWRSDGTPDSERLLVPLRDAGGNVVALCAAVPFLRPADLPPMADETEPDPDDPDPLIEGVKGIYDAVLAVAAERRRPGQALIVTGHCYMAGGLLSELSERRILGGNLHALPAALFPPEVSYVALGHLHRAQRVGGHDAVRYSGAPLALALNEADYHHQIVLVELDGERPAVITPLRVPPLVELLRLPGGGGAALPDQLPALLAALPDGGGAAAAERVRWPYLELTVQLGQPEPGLRESVERLLEAKAVRLVRLAVRQGGDGAALGDEAAGEALAALAPDEVFRRCWQQRRGEAPDAALEAAFQQLLDAVQDGTGSKGEGR